MSDVSQALLSHLLAKCGLGGQTILFVGAGGTIGDPSVEELARRGARVIPTRQSGSGVDESVERIRQAGGKESCPGGLVMQMTDYASIDDAMARLPDMLHGGSLTGVVVNAGGHTKSLIVGPQAHLCDTDRGEVEEFFRKNLLGQREVFRQISRLSRETSDFTGVATCSVAPGNLSRVLDYRMAKVALEELIRFLALDHGRKYGHRYVGIAPGFVNDGNPGNQNSFAVADPVRFNAICDRIPLTKEPPFNSEFVGWATGSEIADVFASIFSPSFRYVNGEILTVDGGFSVNALGNNAI